MRKILRTFCSIAGIFLIAIFSLIIYGDLTIPDTADNPGGGTAVYGIYTSSAFCSDEELYSQKSNVSNRNTTEIRLLGSIPVKTVASTTTERKYLIPGGDLVGLRLKTDGVLIVGTESFQTEYGETDPAQKAGIKTGDTLKSINDIEVLNNAQLAEIISNSDGKSLEAEIIRDGETISLTITPEISVLTGLYKCGLWIRDSTGGIGTLTYYDAENGAFATLGHGIYDTDTGKLLPTEKGEISSATLTGVRKGTNGTAGELKGSINENVFGNIISNNENGIYGTCSIINIDSKALPVAYDNEISTGYAQIICTVESNVKEYYDIEIEKVNRSDENKNMVVRITDERLLKITGGIVQGMSGSPIIQNGKIVGAVTHVFVNEPTKGYGITIENMLNSSG